jgi:hypothetical protein
MPLTCGRGISTLVVVSRLSTLSCARNMPSPRDQVQGCASPLPASELSQGVALRGKRSEARRTLPGRTRPAEHGDLNRLRHRREEGGRLNPGDQSAVHVVVQLGDEPIVTQLVTRAAPGVDA